MHMTMKKMKLALMAKKTRIQIIMPRTTMSYGYAHADVIADDEDQFHLGYEDETYEEGDAGHREDYASSYDGDGDREVHEDDESS